MKTVLSLLCSFLLAACAATNVQTWNRSPSGGTETAALTVIATTDFHGELEGQSGTTSDGLTLTIGGGPTFAFYIKTLKRHTRGPLLWIDGGDLFQGSMASNLFEGAPVVRLMNSLGLDAAALGNHEFDYGPVGDKAVPREKGDDPRGALKARIRDARFPVLAANVKDAQGKIPSWLRASRVLSIGGIRVGIVGGASPGTPGTTNALNLDGLKFEPLMPALKIEAERLRRDERVDVIVLTMHEGGGCSNNSLDAQDDLSSCPEKDNEVIQLAKNLPRGLVNVIVAGHTHKGVAKRVNGTVILQANSHGKYVSWASVQKNGTAEVSGMVPVCLDVVDSPVGKTCDPYFLKQAKGPTTPARFFDETATPDRSTVALLAPELEKVRALKETPLGISAADEITRAYFGESALGNMVADVALEALPGSEIGLANGGGLRDNIAPGPVTYGDIFAVHPFDNQIARMKVPGDKLVELVKVGLFGGGGSYSWSKNLSLTADGCELKELLVDGKPVDPGKNYLVATSDFLAGGGSGVSKVKIPKENVEVFWDKKNLLRELTVEVLKKRGRDLRSADYFSPAIPRQKILNKCEQPQ
ncbi:MAG TPA: bifunctional UDP-sugar hydrolase/5'-nucleotidase [Bdellovibrionota bacterium]|jgi:5'-nucleotidase